MIHVKSILVPMDFSVHSEHALAYAIELGKKLISEIHLVHCYGVDMFTAVPYDPHYVPAIPDDFESQVRKAADRKLAIYRDEVIANGLAAKCHLSKLVPSDAILRLTDELDAGLIVMGTRGLTGLKHVFLGSVAERVIRSAHCPVLTVKADDEPAG